MLKGLILKSSRWNLGLRQAAILTIFFVPLALLVLSASSAEGASTASSRLTTSSGAQTTFCSPALITIPEYGPASPSPSRIVASGLTGSVSNVTVQLHGLTHDFYGDIDMLLTGPSGSRVLLMSDADDTCAGRGVDVNFADGMPSLPQVACPASGGTYKPTNYDYQGQPPDRFPSASTRSDWGSQLSVFNGTSGNGAWRLLVVDDFRMFSGRISNGWCVAITTSTAGTNR
jgi:subtilisin-like proprotein convertase family protein